jgi:8-oxo-dGTP pyrophosphatase MutT (NUDIX family)
LTTLDRRGTTGPVSEPIRPAAARDAASVILARDAPDGLEVLLLQRHPDSRFSPGAFAFPGGRVETDDSAPGIETSCQGLTRAEAARQMPDVRPADRAIGFWVAALREAFEEAGLLLTYGLAGRSTDLEALGDVHAWRARSRADSAAFARMLAECALILATDRLAYWAHWITPEERPVRYDTRFFVAAAWPGQPAEPDGVEVVSARWIGPGEALARQRAGELLLPLPTQRILGTLAEHRGVAATLAAARGRAIRPVRPRILGEVGAERILLPGDPGWF